MARRAPAGRTYERHVAEHAMVVSAAGRLVPKISEAVTVLVNARYREHGIPEGLDPTAGILDECRRIFQESPMRVGDIANALTQAIGSLHAAYDYAAATGTLENPQELFENPKKLLDALSIMERDDALLALALMLVGRATTENLAPSYFLPQGRVSPFADNVRPAIEKAVGLRRPESSPSHAHAA